jgi:hypothetical protein
MALVAPVADAVIELIEAAADFAPEDTEAKADFPVAPNVLRDVPTFPKDADVVPAVVPNCFIEVETALVAVAALVALADIGEKDDAILVLDAEMALVWAAI